MKMYCLYIKSGPIPYLDKDFRTKFDIDFKFIRTEFDIETSLTIRKL